MPASPLPLRVLVASDLAATRRDSVSLPAVEGALAAAFEALAPAIPLSGAPRGAKHTPRALDDFAPAAVARALAAHGAWPNEEAEQTQRLLAALCEPAWVAAEAAWRGLARLIDAAAREGHHAVDFTLHPTTRADVAVQLSDGPLAAAHDDPTRGLSLIVVDHAFDGERSDAAALADLAAWGAALGAPVIAQVSPKVFGVSQAVHVPLLPDLPLRLASLPKKDLDALRRHDDARWLELVFGRWLTRSAWVTEEPRFREEFVPERPETLPYANGVWLAAASLVASHRRAGHAGRAAGFDRHTVHAGLGCVRPPGRPKPGTEPVSIDLQLDDSTAVGLLRAGFTPLVERPEVGVGAFAAHANAWRPDGSRLTRSESIGHQLFAGVAHRIATAAARAAAPAALEADLRAALRAWLTSLSVDEAPTPEALGSVEPVSVTRVEGGLEIHLQPPVRIDGKQVDLTLWLPTPEAEHGA